MLVELNLKENTGGEDVKKTNIIIQARMGSSRLPGKSMMPIWQEVSLFELVVRRITQAELPSRVILSTTDQKRDDVLIPIAQKWGLDVFRGSENDVLGRFVSTLNKFPADAVVRACADNPFLDPVMIDNLIRFFWENYPCDYAMNLGPATGFPDGVGVEMVSADALFRLDSEAEKSSDREHVVTYLHDNPNYRSCYLYADEEFRRPYYRLDIDFPEDLEFVRELVKVLPDVSAPYWTVNEIIATLDKNPDLLKLRKVRD